MTGRAGTDQPWWLCELCYARLYVQTLPASWEWVWQSAVCPECRVRVAQDGGYHVVKGGAYAEVPDPRPWTDLRAQLAQCIADGQRMAGQLEAAEARAEQGEAQLATANDHAEQAMVRLDTARREQHVLTTEWEARRDAMVALHEARVGKWLKKYGADHVEGECWKWTPSYRGSRWNWTPENECTCGLAALLAPDAARTPGGV